MAEYTPNYNLKKPGQDDFYNVDDFNENADIIDQALKAHDDAINEHLHAKTARFVIGTSEAGWTAKDCDYLCDGEDDQEEINNAIDALLASGGEIVILDGTYNITASINIPKDNVSIRGNGNATVLKRMWDSSSPEGVITLISAKGCRVENLQIDGNKTEHTSEYNCGIYLVSSSNNNTITGNTCYNNSSDGIYLYSSSNNTITCNTCYNNYIHGIRLYSSSNNNTITGNTCNNNNSCGICLYLSSNNNTITGNTYNNNNNGIYLSLSSNNNTITGNTCTNNNNNGIRLDSSSNNNTITSNICTNNNNNGIRLASSSNNTITGNTCNNNYDGIYLYSSSNDNTIIGNTCNNNNDGIRLYSSSNNNTITSNTCNNNTSSGICLDSSSKNTITGNSCNDNNYCGICLDSSSNNNTTTGNTCIRGTGQTTDYAQNQYTIRLQGNDNKYNLISLNNCMGKAVKVDGGTGNSVWGNKFDATNDLS